MKRTLVVIALIVLAILCSSISIYNDPEPALEPYTITNIQIVDIPLYISRMDFLKALFVEQFEMALFVFNDLKMCVFTNQLEGMVIFPNIVEVIEKENKEIKDIAFVIHNHPLPTPFSRADIRLYNKLKDNGFTGKFGIYYPFSGELIYYEDK